MKTIKRYYSAKTAAYPASTQSNNNSPKGSAGNPYTLAEFNAFENGTWPGGYVEGMGYVAPDVSIWGSQSGSSDPDSSGSDPSDPWGSDSSDPWASDGSNPNGNNPGGGGGGNTGGTGRPGTSGGTGNSGGKLPCLKKEEITTNRYYTKAQAELQMKYNQWPGGYVYGLGYVLPNAKSLPTSKIIPKNGVEALARAKQFDGTKYETPGSMNTNGIDCSGLVSAAYNMDPRWSTSSTPIGVVPVSTSHASKDAFVNSLNVGDILVWKGKHAALYEGNGKLFHAHGDTVSSTSDLKVYWLEKKGYPVVYRK